MESVLGTILGGSEKRKRTKCKKDGCDRSTTNVDRLCFKHSQKHKQY